MMELTEKKFQMFKKDYDVYGTHTETDPTYRVQRTVKDDSPRCTIHVMWHPVDVEVSIALYGKDIKSMLYCILYGDAEVKELDVINVYGEEYEVRGIIPYNSHRRIDISKKKV